MGGIVAESMVILLSILSLVDHTHHYRTTLKEEEGKEK